MIGWFAYRTARRALRASKKSQAPKPKPLPWKEIARDSAGQWAIIIFATFFVAFVILIGWVNSR